MKKITELCQNVGMDNDTFIGLKLFKGQIKIIFPLGYSIPEDEKECRKSVIDLFKTISLAHENNLDYDESSGLLAKENCMPVDSYMWILSDYINNGLYVDNEKRYIQSQKGKINWKRTFKTKYYISHNNLIYLNPVVEQSFIKSNIITDIHSYCIDKSIDILGPLYDGLNKLNMIKPDNNRIKYFINVIDKELLKTFDDRKKLLLYHLRRILLEEVDNGKIPIRNFGVKNYDHVWEFMVNKVFGDDGINKYYPTTEYHINGKNKYIPSKLRPDTFFVYNDNFYILDSKYYKFGITCLNKHLPASESIEKQITYKEYIKMNFNYDEKYENIYSAFIIPFNKKDNLFATKLSIFNCGYAVCNWEFEDQKHKISIILIDTKDLIDNYFRKNSNLKKLLVDTI